MTHRTIAVTAGTKDGTRPLLVCECGVTLGRDRDPRTLLAAEAHHEDVRS